MRFSVIRIASSWDKQRKKIIWMMVAIFLFLVLVGYGVWFACQPAKCPAIGERKVSIEQVILIPLDSNMTPEQIQEFLNASGEVRTLPQD